MCFNVYWFLPITNPSIHVYIYLSLLYLFARQAVRWGPFINLSVAQETWNHQGREDFFFSFHDFWFSGTLWKIVNLKLFFVSGMELQNQSHPCVCLSDNQSCLCVCLSFHMLIRWLEWFIFSRIPDFDFLGHCEKLTVNLRLFLSQGGVTKSIVSVCKSVLSVCVPVLSHAN